MLLYHRGTGKVYYYKNDSARMQAYETEDYLVLSTNEENINYAKRFFRGGKELKIESLLIYEVTDIPHTRNEG